MDHSKRIRQVEEELARLNNNVAMAREFLRLLKMERHNIRKSIGLPDMIYCGHANQKYAHGFHVLLNGRGIGSVYEDGGSWRTNKDRTTPYFSKTDAIWSLIDLAGKAEEVENAIS